MPTPIPSPLHSVIEWFRGSHLRLLIAGLVAVGLIASVSIFAAEDKTQTDEVFVHSEEMNSPITKEFPFRVDWKPRANRSLWSVRAYIDNFRVAVWDYNKPGEPATGNAQWNYEYNWGITPDSQTATKLFDNNLLQPGTHAMKILVCANNNPLESCQLIKSLDRGFTIGSNSAITTFQQAPISITGLSEGNPVKAGNDVRIQRGTASAATAKAASADAAAKVKASVEKLVQSVKTASDDNLESAYEKPEEIKDGVKSDKTSGVFDNKKSGLSLRNLLGGTALATKSITVRVNPVGLTPGYVTVEAQPQKCSPSQKPVPGGGEVTFGGCANDVNTVIVHPGSFQNGNQKCDATSGQTFAVNNGGTTQANYNCYALTPNNPAPPGGGGGGGGEGGNPTKPNPNQQTGHLTVWVNPHPRLKNVPVTTTGAGCGGQKTTGDDGKIEWACKVGEQVTIHVPKTVTPPDHPNERWTVPSNERIIVKGKDDYAVNFNYNFDGTVDGNGNLTPPDAFENKAPMLSLMELGCSYAKVDAYKLLAVSHGSPASTSGYLAGYTATVDGKQVTDVKFPPGTWETTEEQFKDLTVPMYQPAPQNNLPTYRFNQLALGNLCDGQPHSVTLTAKTLDGFATSIIINQVKSQEQPPPPTPQKGNLTVATYNDLNCNKQKDADETALADVPYGYTGPNGAKKDDLNTGQTGQGTTSDLATGSYQVTIKTPDGYKACSDTTQSTDVKGSETSTVNFGLQKIQASPSPSPIASATPSPGSTPTPATSASPNTPSGPTEPGDQDTEPVPASTVGGIAGNLPKTGQAGLILFLTFLAASGIYYGGRKLIAKRHGK